MSGLTIHLSPEFVRMVGWVLLHFVWQGTLLALLLSLAMAFCKRASVRYAIAVATLLLMLALPFMTFLVLQRSATEPGASAEETIQPEPDNSATTGLITRRTHVVAPKAEESGPEAMQWLVRIWMIGVALFSLRSAGGFLLMQRLRRIATKPASGGLLRLCMAMQQRMGIERAVRFCFSAVLQVPAVVGGIRPIVLLPVTALTGLSDSQIEAIVAHELAHIQRLDYFVNVFQVFAETVLFYHPAVWWVNKRIRTERENCCDDTAISLCGNRLEYIRALTHLESARITPRFAMAANGSPLKARVRRLLGMAEENEGVRSGSSLVGVMVVAGIVLAASSLVSGAKAQVEKPEPAEPPAPVVAPNIDIRVPPIRLAIPSVHVRAPILPEVSVPAVRVHVPAVNVDLPTRHVEAPPMMSFAIPAVHVHLPPMNFAIPAIHVRPMAGQATAAAQSQTQPSESYIDGMKAAGFGDLTVDELVAMKIQGVTPEYVREMRASGLKLDADELIGLKVQGVTPQYVKELHAAYPNIDADTIMGMKVQGVTPEYAAQFAKLGIKADAEELIGLKVQGVTPEYVRDMRATGINFDSDELIGLKVQGVTPAYVAALKSAGLTKLDADEIMGAKAMGLTPEFIEKARSHGFKDLDLDKLMELKNTGVL